MGTVQQLESQLDETLNKKAPIKVPPEGRKAIAGSLWWIALVIGVLQLYAAIKLWQWGHAVDYLNRAISYYAPAYAHHLGLFYYLSLFSMAIVALFMLLAAPSLKAMKKDGWNLLFYGLLVQAVCAVFQLFADGGGLSDFFGAAFSTVVGAYLLFQVRDNFVGIRAAEHRPFPKSDVTATHHVKPVDDEDEDEAARAGKDEPAGKD
jgi:hypothetical protein